MTKKNKQTKDKAKILAKKSIVPCQQKQCGFLHNGCPKCSECGAKPDMISEGCKTCFDCEFKPGCLRNGENQHNRNENTLKNEMPEELKKLLMGKMKTKIAPRKVLMANGEIQDEEPEPFQPQKQYGKNPGLPGGEEFENELKRELIRQMAREMLDNAKNPISKEKDDKDNKNKGKGNCKDKGSDEPEEETGRQVPYIGYIC